jgi:hypothetical protein
MIVTIRLEKKLNHAIFCYTFKSEQETRTFSTKVVEIVLSKHKTLGISMT